MHQPTTCAWNISFASISRSVLRERAHAVDHRQTAVELAVGDVVLHHLVDPVGGDLHLPIGFLVVHELLAELLEHLQERLVLVAGRERVSE